MPLSPDDLKSRYDRLSFRFTPGIKAKLHRLARTAEVLPTQWLEEAITFPIRLTPAARMQLEELADKAECSPTAWLEGSIARAFDSQIGGVAIDASKGEWRCRCKPNSEFDTSANPRNVSACLKCGATRPKKVKKDHQNG